MSSFEEESATMAAGKMDAATLSRVSQLAQEQVALEAEVKRLDESLKGAKEKLRKVSEEDLPHAMTVLGLEELRLEDGSRIKVETRYHASIPEKNAPRAFKWLRDHNYGSLIKNTVVAVFGKGEDKAAAELIKFATKHEIDFSAKEAVHPSTLRAFVREKDEAGSPVPEDLFGVHKQKLASVKK